MVFKFTRSLIPFKGLSDKLSINFVATMPYNEFNQAQRKRGGKLFRANKIMAFCVASMYITAKKVSQYLIITNGNHSILLPNRGLFSLNSTTVHSCSVFTMLAACHQCFIRYVSIFYISSISITMMAGHLAASAILFGASTS